MYLKIDYSIKLQENKYISSRVGALISKHLAYDYLKKKIFSVISQDFGATQCLAKGMHLQHF